VTAARDDSCFGLDDSILFTTIDQDLKPLLPRLEMLARTESVIL
jgi:hypothetical protein